MLFFFKWVRISPEIDWCHYQGASPPSNNDKDPYEVKHYIRTQCGGGAGGSANKSSSIGRNMGCLIFKQQEISEIKSKQMPLTLPAHYTDWLSIKVILIDKRTEGELTRIFHFSYRFIKKYRVESYPLISIILSFQKKTSYRM